MISPRSRIIELVEQGAIPAEKIGDALAAVNAIPDDKAWRTFVDHLLLWLSGLALAFSVLFFIAYNWNEIGHFAKFGLVEMAMVLAVLAYWKLGERRVAGEVSLLTATILLGVLLGLHDQTYQTGADAWQLFVKWVLLMLPWALIGRFAAIWIVWVTLINLSIVLYYRAFHSVAGFMFSSDEVVLWLLFIFNALALVVWELSARYWRWLAERWAIRLLAMGVGISITCLVIVRIMESQYREFDLFSVLMWVDLFSVLMWAVCLVALYVVYRRIRPDLFMLAGGSLSVIVVIVIFCVTHIPLSVEGHFLILAILVSALGAGATIWLRHVYRELWT